MGDFDRHLIQRTPFGGGSDRSYGRNRLDQTRIVVLYAADALTDRLADHAAGRVGPKEDRVLREWLELAVAFVQTLPAKPPKSDLGVES